MFCKNCGRQLDEGESYCPICGTVNSPEAATTGYSVPVMDDSVKDRMAGEVLKWGILSLAFAVSGCLSLLGFIFSFTARKKAKEYARVCGELEGRARVGNILGWVGFGVGLGYTAFWVLYFLFFGLIFAILAASGAL
jgi:hypothetical protein